MPKVVHTRLGTLDIALFDEIKQIYFKIQLKLNVFVRFAVFSLKMDFFKTSLIFIWFHSFSIYFSLFYKNRLKKCINLCIPT